LEALAEFAGPLATQPQLSPEAGVAGPDSCMEQVSFTGSMKTAQYMPEQIPRLITLERRRPLPGEEKRVVYHFG